MNGANDPRTVSVGTSAVLLSPANGRWSARSFVNTGAGSVFIGNSNVTATGATKGREIAATKEHVDDFSKGAIYAISGSGSNDVSVWEIQE